MGIINQQTSRGTAMSGSSLGVSKGTTLGPVSVSRFVRWEFATRSPCRGLSGGSLQLQPGEIRQRGWDILKVERKNDGLLGAKVGDKKVFYMINILLIPSIILSNILLLTDT